MKRLALLLAACILFAVPLQAQVTCGGPSPCLALANTWPAAQTFTSAMQANGAITAAAGITSTTYGTATNCSSAAAPAVCASAAAGSVVIAAAGTTVTVNTTRVTANSQIFVQEDSSLGTKLSVTCNVTTGRVYTVTARTAATSYDHG